MRIDKTDLTALSMTGAAGAPRVMKKIDTPALPGDMFVQSLHPPLPESVVADARAVFGMKGLEKRGMDYRVGSYTQGADGTTYVSYSSDRKAEEGKDIRGYVAAVSPQGEILWESPVREDGLKDLKMGPDGTLFAQTKDHLKALNSDGTTKYEHTFEAPVKDHMIDSAGNHYFVNSDSRELYLVDKEGKKADLPEAFRGIKGHEVVQKGPDSIYMRDGNDIYSLDLKAGKSEKVTFQDSVEKTPNFSRYIDHFEVDDAGVVRLWVNNQTTEASRPYVDDFHFGIGGFRRWGGMPHPPMDDSWYTPRVFTDQSVEQIDGSGRVAWSTAGLGDSPVASQLKDGTVIYSRNTAEYMPNPNYIENPPPNTPYQSRETATGRTFVGTIAPDGKKNEKAFTVEGNVQRIMTNGETGNFFICHGENKASEFNSKGELISSKTIPQVDMKLYPEGLSGKKGVILRDSERSKAYSFDVETGKLTKLTETEMDYSYKVLIREMEKEEDTSSAPVAQTLEEDDKYIYIDGIKMEKN